jgi:TetR/AcrR family transcriptional regulator, cholesterol catabolism regulator
MEEKEKYILEQAKILFYRYGVKSVSMDDLARHAGVSKKTLYEYFCDKTDIIKRVLEMHCQIQQEKIHSVGCSHLNSIDVLIAVTEFIVAEIKDTNPAFIYDLNKYYPEIMRTFVEGKNKFVHDCIIQNLHCGIKEGLYRTDMNQDIIALIYTSRMNTLAQDEVMKFQDFSYADVVKELMLYHIRGISSAKGIKYYEEKIKNETPLKS